MLNRLINTIAFGILIILLFALTGCHWTQIEKIEYYPDGAVKSKTTDTSHGFSPQWSGGDGKQMPLSNVKISGVGI